jgi:capsular polysaccharide biosynthesis protein
MLLVGLEEQKGAAPDLNNEVVGLQALTETMLTAVTTRPIAQDVIQRLNLSIPPKSFLENLSAQRVGTSQYIEVSYKDSDPEKAQRIANTLGDVFSENAPDINPSSSEIIVKVWEPAVVADSPINPALLRNAFVGLLLGLMLGLGLAFVLEYLDKSWTSLDEVEQVSGVPALGAIPTSKSRKR